jgi:LmbE family N-acetylglucosaminyl deacetylase
MAHPDDETLISGTLAKLTARGYPVTVAFVTSGDDGHDVSGQNLSGAALGRTREQEASQSLRSMGIQQPPVFLQFPDSHVKEHFYDLSRALGKLFKQVNPVVVISFGPDGITDDWDHIMTGLVTDHVFDITDSGKLLLHMAISDKTSSKFPIRAPVADKAINLRIDVSDYAPARISSTDAHRTQFPSIYRQRWKSYVFNMPSEEFIIARNRAGEQLIRDCFYQKRYNHEKK